MFLSLWATGSVFPSQCMSWMHPLSSPSSLPSSYAFLCGAIYPFLMLSVVKPVLTVLCQSHYKSGQALFV